MSIKAKLMSMHIGLMNNEDTHEIIIITDSITVASKILESQINSLQKIIILLTSRIKSFLSRDNKNAIHFWQCPKKTEWPRHKLVDDQVKATSDIPILPSKNSYLFSKKKEYNDMLKEWQTSFSTSKKRGQLFLDFEDKKQHIIKPTYAKGSSWLPFIGFTNFLCTQFTCITTGHAPIGEYQQCFFSNFALSYPYG